MSIAVNKLLFARYMKDSKICGEFAIEARVTMSFGMRAPNMNAQGSTAPKPKRKTSDVLISEW